MSLLSVARLDIREVQYRGRPGRRWAETGGKAKGPQEEDPGGLYLREEYVQRREASAEKFIPRIFLFHNLP